MSAQGTRQAAQAPETLFDPTSNSQDSYVIALDQGTTSSRAVLVDRSGAIRAITQSPFPQIFPRPGWVEHDPKDILSSQLKVLTELLVSQGLSPEDIDSIGITNQRETTIVWNRHTGEPVHNAIVWQCRRAAEAIDELKQDETIVEEIPVRARPYSRRLFFGEQDRLDPRQRRRRARSGASGRPAVRHRGYVAHLESHARARACDRLYECQPYDALQHQHGRMGRLVVRAVFDPASYASRSAAFFGQFRANEQ